MDCLLSPPSKKRRVVGNISIPMIECKRKFNLPHKFPSTASQKHNVVVKNDRVVSTINAQIGSNFSEPRNINLVPANNIRKMRIKTREGKDLGEVEVKFVCRSNVGNSLKISYQAQTTTHKKSSPVNYSMAPSKGLSGLLSTLATQNCNAPSQLPVRSIPSKEITTVSGKLPGAEEQTKNVRQKHYILASVNKMVQSNKVLVLNQDRRKLLNNVPSHKENETIQNNLMLLNRKKDFSSNQKIVVTKKNTCITINPLVNSQTNVSEDKKLDTKYRQLAASKFPVVRCEKLLISESKDDTDGVLSASKKICDNSNGNAIVKGNSTGNNSISNNSLRRIESNDSKERRDSTEKKLNVADDVSVDNDVIILCNKRETAEQGKKLIPIRTNTNVVHHKDQCKSNAALASPIPSKNNISCTNRSIGNKETKVEKNINVDNKAQETVDDPRKKKQTNKVQDCLNVIKEALTSVKDEDLRAKALQALADCGIGVPKQIPITPPDQLKTVHDSQVQTDVFGLLDKQSFVLVKESMPTLERIKQTKRSAINPPTANAETQTKPKEIQAYKKTVPCNPIDNVDLFPMWSSVPVDTTPDIANYFKQYFNNNNNVNRVKKVLSTPHSLYKKVATQLEKDYENLQQYDEDGLLNIHRAVMNNHLREVERLLLVLKASKVHIDVLTVDGHTSLELAIKFEASERIIKLLLDAGAKPVHSELVHETAIILASKLSAPSLRQLLNYVTERELLNRVDTSGTGALHYCALNGNLEGVLALIEAGADVNLRDNRSGRTPFFHALENNHTLIAHKLLEKGAIADLSNFSGQSILSIVDESKSLSLKAALKEIVI